MSAYYCPMIRRKCQKISCAWWDWKHDECHIKSLSINIDSISQASYQMMKLLNVAKEMDVDD
jgi:hypothetical protein